MNWNYPNAKIYEIKCNVTGLVYIGSTNKELDERLKAHEKSFNQFKIDKHHFISVFDIFENNNYTIYLLEKFPCDSKFELQRREGQWQLHIPCVNKNVAGRTKKEYQQENKEQFANSCKRYRENHPEKVSEYAKMYRDTHQEQIKEYRKEFNKLTIQCECGCIVKKPNVAKHKRTQKHINLMVNK